MKKLFISLSALFVCSLCFADDFNYELLKNPSKEIAVIDFKDGSGDILSRILMTKSILYSLTLFALTENTIVKFVLELFNAW